MKRVQILALLAVVLSAGTLSASSADAATRAWSSPATLTAPANASGRTQVSLAEDGDAISLWTIGYGVKGAVRVGGVRPQLTEAHDVVQAAIRPDGGSYGAVQTLSNPEAGAYAEGIGTAADGEAVALWEQDQPGETNFGEKDELEYAIRPSGAAAFGASTVVPGSGAGAGEAAIALNGAGEGVIAWSGPGEADVEYLTRAADGAFSAVDDVKAPSGVGFDDVHAAIDARGDALISWNADAETPEKTHTGRVEAIERAHGGAFGSPVDLSAAGVGDYSPVPAIDASGNATLAWIVAEENPATKKLGYKVQARTLSNAGTVGKTVQTLSTFGALPEEPRIAADGAGEATVLWTHVVGSAVAAEAAVLPSAGGEFEPAVLLDPSAGAFYDDAVTVSETGEAILMWAHLVSSEPMAEQLVEATRTPGGAFGPATPVSSAGSGFDSPSVAVDIAGDAAAAWSAFGEGALFEQTSNYVIPAAPVVTQPPGGSTTSTAKNPPPAAPFTVSVRAGAPSLAKLRKGGAIKITCTLTAAGTCTVHLTISAATARKLGLHVTKHAKTVAIGALTITLSAAGAKSASLKLTSQAFRHIKHDRRPLVFTLTVSAASTGGHTATARPLALSVH